MTIPRLIAIVFIFICVSIAWLVLAGVTVVRTQDTGTSLAPRVQELWGPALTQTAPTASINSADRAIRGQAVQIDSSDINVGLHLDYRQKGLQWYSTYEVDFDGRYKFVNPLEQPVTLTVQYNFPASNTLYDKFGFELNGTQVLPESDLSKGLTGTITLKANETANLHITYKSRGVDRWLYRFGSGGITNVKNFNLVVTTDFREFDFPQQTVSSSSKDATSDGWKLGWKFDSLVAGFNIGVEMPKKLQPGALVSQMSFFAPVSLFFFFTVMVILGAVRGRATSLHPMHYFFIGAAFFAFHLLFAYLADHVSIEISFVTAALVSLLLVVTYVGRMANWKFALREVGIAQLLFLVLFSYAFFYEGYTGLVITIGAIITLAVMMQVTAKVNWEEVFKGKQASRQVDK